MAMTNTTLVAWIGAGATTLAAVIPLAAKWVADRRGPFLPIGDKKRTAVGMWTGTGGDLFVENGGQRIAMTATFVIRQSGRRIKAEASVAIVNAPDASQKIKMSGGFCNQDLMQLSYRSADPKRVQFGVILLKLSGSGDELNGHYAGYSPKRECLIVGDFHLRRQGE
jgi:hypothetical protein